jgi:ribose transport system ATP-binding protein
MSVAVPLLQAAAIAKTFGTVVALRAVDLEVAPGQVHALLGANGDGKSTLVKILTGVLRADAGAVSIHGQPAAVHRPGDARRHGLATVFQDPAMAGDLTIAENLRLTDSDIGVVRRHLAEMDLDGLDFGEQVRDIPLPFLRMLDLARALTFDPQLLLLDEITAALPPDLSERVFAVMRQWRARNRSVLFISHRLAEVREHCDMCTVLRDGRDVASFVPGEGGEGAIVAAMLGEAAVGVRDEARVRATAAVVGERPAFEARNLGAGRQLHDVSLAVHPGEVLGLAALEGQGQDALFDILAGNRKPDHGELVIDGRPVRARHPFDVIRHGVVLVPADRLHALLPQRSIRENIALPLFNRIAKWGPIRPAQERSRVNAAVQRLSIDTRAASQVRRLSGGNQQKVTIARWLAGGLRVMLLFDPTRGIDVGTKHQVYDLVRSLADEGTAILMFTSELREISLVCDRAAVLHGGRIVAELAADAGENALLTAAHGLAEESVA